MAIMCIQFTSFIQFFMGFAKHLCLHTSTALLHLSFHNSVMVQDTSNLLCFKKLPSSNPRIHTWQSTVIREESLCREFKRLASWESLGLFLSATMISD